MDYVRLVLDLLAIIGGSSMVALLSPWRVQPRAVPLLLFVVALVVMVLPLTVVLAMSLMVPAALIMRYLGIELADNEPADYSPATAKARSTAQAARMRVQERGWRRKPVEVTEFATRAYEPPGEPDEAELPDADADVDVGEPEQPAKSAADEARERLGQTTGSTSAGWYGQRAGLRNQHTPVRSFVPSLL
jgi:hypothetical protein